MLADDPSISDDVLLYRRIGWQVLGGIDRFEPGETPNVNANAFNDYSAARARELGYAGPCMSVGLGHLITRAGITPAQAMLQHYDDYGLACISVGSIRNLKRGDGGACPQGVLACSTPTEPWHGVVFDLGGDRKTATAKAVSRVAEWVVPLVRPH